MSTCPVPSMLRYPAKQQFERTIAVPLLSCCLTTPSRFASDRKRTLGMSAVVKRKATHDTRAGPHILLHWHLLHICSSCVDCVAVIDVVLRIRKRLAVLAHTILAFGTTLSLQGHGKRCQRRTFSCKGCLTFTTSHAVWQKYCYLFRHAGMII